MMTFHFCPLETQHALEILNWQYSAPYDIYNFQEENHTTDLNYLIDPCHHFFAILNLQTKLEGYCSFGKDGQVSGGCYTAPALDIGMGMRPDLTGKGYGKVYAQAIAQYGAQHYQANRLRVTIAAFNQRAQRVWQQLGFRLVETFKKSNSQEQFVVLLSAV